MPTQNQKPTEPLNPHLASLIGVYINNGNNQDTFSRLWAALFGGRLRKTLTITASSFVLLAGILTYVAYGTSFNLGKVQAAQIPVNAGQSDSVLQQQFKQQYGNYTFSLAKPDGSIGTHKLADAGISVNAEASVQQVRQAIRHLGWQRFAWWGTTQVPLTIKKTPSQFDAFIAANVAVANQPAKDAVITVAKGKALITDGVNGSTYQIDKGNRQLVTAATSLKPLSATLVPTTVKPAISASHLSSAAAKINAYTAHSVNFKMGERIIIASPSDIGNWLDIEPVPAQKTVDVTVNSGKIQAYVDKMTASSIYVPRAQISTTDSSGNVTVLSAGRNGSGIANKATVVKNVANQLQQSGSVINADLEITQENFKNINAADYEKWMVADVTTKRMYAYEHNKLVRTFLISAGAPKTPTVLGTYQIYRKVPLRTMRGANADGSRYVQPDVKYVNYFYQDYAIHGNYWRPSSYFGNVNSSHGCIGITDSDAEWIYNWAPIGTTVITHN